MMRSFMGLYSVGILIPYLEADERREDDPGKKDHPVS
jgi:hypothetical protein